MRWILLAIALGLALPSAALAQARGAALMAMDANHDGSITRAEAEAGRAVLFARLDADGDAVLSSEERAGQQGGERLARVLARADANGDGLISRAEFMGQPYRGFDRFDTDHDGVLSGAELAALRARQSGGA